jgi:MFS superfamily sulfate permease-like transporter
MTRLSPYRRRRQLRVRVIAACLALLLALPPLLSAFAALRDFGAGRILVALVVVGVAAYLLAARRPSRDD